MKLRCLFLNLVESLKKVVVCFAWKGKCELWAPWIDKSIEPEIFFQEQLRE